MKLSSSLLDVSRTETLSAFRRLSRRPLASIVSIVALACGIGAAATTWSLMHALLLDPLPVAEPESLFTLSMRYTGNGPERVSNTHSYTLYQPIRDSDAFDQVIAGGFVAVDGDEGERLDAYFASHDFFQMLGVPLALGRSFSVADDVRGAATTAILSYAYWQQRFDGDPDLLGQTLAVGAVEAVVIGVAAEGFRGISLTRAPQIYLPLHTVADATVGALGLTNYMAEPIPPATSSPIAWLTIVGRLPPGASATGASSRLEVTFSEAYPQVEASPEAVLTPINAAAVPAAAREGMRQFVFLLAGTVGLLMLAACLSAGMLLLVRTEARRHELATARALGASSPRIAIGIAVEGMLLALAGAVAATGVVYWLLRGLRVFDLPGRVPIDLLQLSLDEPLFAAIAAGAVVSTLMITLIAVVVASSIKLTGVVGARAHATRGRAHFGARSWLVIGQVTVALVLLAGTGLFARSLMAALTLNPGYDTGRIVTHVVSFPFERADALFDELVQRLDASPFVEGASRIQNQGGMSTFGQLEVDGVPQRFPATVEYRGTGPQYFSTMGLLVADGRAFSAADREGTEPVAIASESLAAVLEAGNGTAIGRRIRVGVNDEPVTVVGVVPDIITNVDSLEPLVLYMPLEQATRSGQDLLVFRVSSDPAAAIREANAMIRDLDPEVAPGPMRTINEQLVAQLGAQRFGALVMGALGSIAILLTGMGIFVLAESIGTSRRREFGIRAALGARGSTLAGRILIETLRLVGIGALIGMVVSWASARAFRAFLFQVEPLDAATLSGVAILMLSLAIIVSLRPAIAAMRVDLARLLRDE
jgi:predicted permease